MEHQQIEYSASTAPICAVETEAALIGAVMIDNRVYERVVEHVDANDFFEPLHNRLWNVIGREIGQGRMANPVLLKPLFEHDPAIIELGGPGYLARLTGSGASLIGAVHFAKQIRDLARRRALRDEMVRLVGMVGHSSQSLADSLNAPETTLSSIVEEIDASMTKALRQNEAAQSFSIGGAFDVTMEEIEAEARGETPPGLAVDGFDDWNDLTGNIRRGEVIILAGRPSMGKTAVGLSTALGMARAGHGTAFISLEMSVRELMKRAITDLIFEYGNSASFKAVKTGALNSFDRDKIAEARARIGSWPMILRQDAGLKVGRLAMIIRRYKRQMEARGESLACVFIDYLGLVRADGDKVKRYEEVSEVSRTIKQIARELDVAIVLLAQLNREVERREDKRPQLSDLRDSGEIEQDADIVLFVYREEYYLSRAEPDQHDKKRADWEIAIGRARDRVELIAAKVRNGEIGRRNCYFFGANQAVRGSDFFSGRRV